VVVSRILVGTFPLLVDRAGSWIGGAGSSQLGAFPLLLDGHDSWTGSGCVEMGRVGTFYEVPSPCLILSCSRVGSRVAVTSSLSVKCIGAPLKYCQ
jgi:hypothetical protein